MKGLGKAELILPLTILLAAFMLGISEFMITFELTPPGGDPISDQLAGDRHGFAMLVLAICAGASLWMAIATGLRAWAWAIAGFGLAALVLFLVVDLPDVNVVGDVEAPGDLGLTAAEAVPRPGFWLEAGAAVVLALAAIAYATQSTEQRQAPLRLLDSRGDRKPDSEQPHSRRPADSGT